jgi:hypothetical protein
MAWCWLAAVRDIHITRSLRAVHFATGALDGIQSLCTVEKRFAITCAVQSEEYLRAMSAPSNGSERTSPLSDLLSISPSRLRPGVVHVEWKGS